MCSSARRGSLPRPSRSPPGRAGGANGKASPVQGIRGTLPHAGTTLYTHLLTAGHTHPHNPSRRGHSDPEFSRTRWNPRDFCAAQTTTILKLLATLHGNATGKQPVVHTSGAPQAIPTRKATCDLSNS